MNVPKLRFKEFDDEWDYKIFDELINIKSESYNPSLNKENYKCIELEHINQNTGTINGYCNSQDQKSNKNIFKKNEVLFGKLRPYLKKYWYATFDGVCSSEIWVGKSKDQNIVTNKFIYDLFQSHYFLQLCNLSTGSKMPRADWPFIKEQSIAIPNILEQKKISETLELLDKKIELQSKKVEDLKLFKLYSKNLILNNYEYKCKLKDILIKWNKKNKDNSIKYVESISNKYGFIAQSDQFEDRNVASKNLKNYYVIEKGVFGYNPSRLNVGSLALKINNNISVVSPLYECFTTTQNKEYLLEWFDSKYFRKETITKFEGGVRNTLNFSNLCEIEIGLPSKEKQNKYAYFFKNFNNKIEIETNKLNKLIELKKGLMQNMFV